VNQGEIRSASRNHAREVIEREALAIPGAREVPSPWNIGRRVEAWRIGYAAAFEGLSTDVDDYYCRENFYRAMRRAFLAGKTAAECDGEAKPAHKLTERDG
jgi:hypothetical protein